MKRIHAIAAAGAALLTLGCGAALAQTVSGADPYVQGYAAGATAKEHNSFDAFDKGYQAGQTAQDSQTAQDNMRSATNSALAYDKGYQAGVAAGATRTGTDQQEAFNQGYTARGMEDRRMAGRAFDNGYEAGATQHHYHELDYP